MENPDPLKLVASQSEGTVPDSGAPLRGYCILVVENDALLAIGYEEILREAGAEVVGPAASVRAAANLAEAKGISAALLDIRLSDGEVWPVAGLLAERGIPFAFCTGYLDPGRVSERWPGRPIVVKPASPERIIGALTRMLAT